MRLERDRPLVLNNRLGRAPARGRRFALAGLGLLAAGALALGSGLAFYPTRNESAADMLRPGQARAAALAVDCRARADGLQDDLSAIAAGFDGTVGIAVTKAGCDWIAGERLQQYFPQQSVSKLWVSLAVLDAVDKGGIALDQPLTIRPGDLTLFNQPLRHEVLELGSATRPVLGLMRDALSLSDNTANDRLLWRVGGPDRVRALLRRQAIVGIRFGPGERLLQSEVAGLRWNQDLALGRNFELARARLPLATREAALARYVADPADGATPAGLAQALARLARGELLSPASTSLLLEVMARSRSGPMRLKAGVPRNWKVYHKTGTGQELRGLATGYNDVALLEAPDGTVYAVAVMVAATRQPVRQRMAMMQAVSGAVARFHHGE